MEEMPITTVSEQLENLEESTEDTNQESIAAQSSQENSDSAVDEDLQEEAANKMPTKS